MGGEKMQEPDRVNPEEYWPEIRGPSLGLRTPVIKRNGGRRRDPPNTGQNRHLAVADGEKVKKRKLSINGRMRLSRKQQSIKGVKKINRIRWDVGEVLARS